MSLSSLDISHTYTAYYFTKSPLTHHTDETESVLVKIEISTPNLLENEETEILNYGYPKYYVKHG